MSIIGSSEVYRGGNYRTFSSMSNRDYTEKWYFQSNFYY